MLHLREAPPVAVAVHLFPERLQRFAHVVAYADMRRDDQFSAAAAQAVTKVRILIERDALVPAADLFDRFAAREDERYRIAFFLIRQIPEARAADAERRRHAPRDGTADEPLRMGARDSAHS